MKVKSGIYLISSTINSKKYIGSSKDLKDRLLEHHRKVTNNEHENSRVQNHFNKYGSSSLIYYIIEYCPEEILEEREQYYVDLINPWFNIIKIIKRRKGDYKHRKKAKEKIRKSSLKMWNQNREKMINSLKKGEENKSSKLTELQVKEIKLSLLNPNITIKSLCLKYDISKPVILGIKNGQGWIHILPELSEKLKNSKRKISDPISKNITINQIEELKLDIISEKFTINQLSIKYNISERSVTGIKNCSNWINVRHDLNDQMKKSSFIRKKPISNFNINTVKTKQDNFKNGNSKLGKLNIDQIKDIKNLKLQGYTNKKLAEIFNVHCNTISYINTGRTFNWL